MKKGKLVKEGKFWKIVSSDLKNPMMVPGDFGLTDDMNGKDISFDTTGGPVKSIIFEGKTYSKRQLNMTPAPGQAGRDQNPANTVSTLISKAHAPYNFVPLNDIIVTVEQGITEKLSGFIDLDIKTLTPLFIRGIGSKFYGVDGPRIPGSSLRGMLRSLVEIISFSEMVFTDKKKRFFYRNISDSFYKDKFIKRDGRSRPPVVRSIVNSGWLLKKGREYHIIPSDFDSTGRQYYKINGSFMGSAFRPQGSSINLPIYSFKKLYIDLSSITKLKNKPGFDLEYNIIGTFSDIPGRLKCTHESFLVATGPFARKKHYQWVVNGPSKTLASINVSSQMEIYQMDDNIDENASLLKMLETNGGNPVPCFYLLDSSGTIEAIGHTGIFRLPYQFNVGDFSLQQISSSKIDYTTSIFGSLDAAGKIFVEDALPFPDKKVETYQHDVLLRVLQSPRPTSFQLYIEQPNGATKQKNNLHHWGVNGAKIRGHKLYWHRSTSDNMTKKHSWAFNTSDVNDLNKKKKLLTEAVRPVRDNQHFKARIRYNDLTMEELGATLLALDLPEGCSHKLGMGKPLGLGSIRITPVLSVFDPLKRYSTFYSQNSKSWAIEKVVSNSVDHYKFLFVDQINLQIEEAYKDVDDFWNRNERMKELKAMLLFENNMPDNEKWLEETSYMSIEKPVLDENDKPILDDYDRPKSENEYSDRSILAKPSVFKGRK